MAGRMSNRDRIAHLRAEADAAAKERAANVRPAAKRSARTRAPKPAARVRFAWSVCGPSGKEVVQYPYAQQEEARAEAARRTEASGQTHFVAKAEVRVD